MKQLKAIVDCIELNVRFDLDVKLIVIGENIEKHDLLIYICMHICMYVFGAGAPPGSH